MNFQLNYDTFISTLVNKLLVFFRDDEGIDSSIEDMAIVRDSGPGGNVAAEARKFTIWSTQFTTFTIVSVSYYQGTTVTVSAMCQPSFAASCFG